MSDDEDSYVVYGEPFEDEPEDALRSLKQRVQPQAYERRVLNERGRPQRFHGAFTGGFSAGYFNSVGSKEGFKPQSFTSSRQSHAGNLRQSATAQPEDFMDDEDLGEFGIAPRRFRTRKEFDDNHIFQTLSESLGGSSIIPVASDVIKRSLIPGGTSLADRLIRRFGWKSVDSNDINTDTAEDGGSDVTLVAPSKASSAKSSTGMEYALINFAPKVNTFGLGYSGLDPRIALGQRSVTSYFDPAGESVIALRMRQRSFNPSIGVTRDGIRGQAFGVGALHSEDADIYAEDSLALYDFSIGNAEEEVSDVDNDDEEAELEAARAGRFSDLQRKQPLSKRRKFDKTIDGWTAPGCSRVSISGEETATQAIKGFVAPQLSDSSFLVTKSPFFVLPKPVILPPGYSSIFNPDCIRAPTDINKNDESDEPMPFSDNSTIFSLIPDKDRQKLANAVAAATMASLDGKVLSTSSSSIPLASASLAADALNQPLLLKPYLADAAKQARFDAYQVLCRRGFQPKEAYERCASGQSDVSQKLQSIEQEMFSALLRNSQNATQQSTLQNSPFSTSVSAQYSAFNADSPIAGSQNRDSSTALSAGRLAPEKQKLVSNLLKSRFRSAGEHDISKELTEAQEEAKRKDIEALDMTDPRDNAAANDAYGVLTRRVLAWHPAPLLCKRVNVPNPYPDSTFVGCPEDRRLHHPTRHRRGRGKGRMSSQRDNSFSLFDILDVNIIDGEQNEGDDSDESVGAATTTPLSAVTDLSTTIPSSRQPSIFDALFNAAEDARKAKPCDIIPLPDSSVAAPLAQIEAPNKPVKPRLLGPSRPPPATFVCSALLPGNEKIEFNDETPSMDLFKSIFASDEELEPSDTEVEEDPMSTLESTSEISHLADCGDQTYLTEDPTIKTQPNLPEIQSTQSISSVASADAYVHQIFRHLFNPKIDGESPLFAVSAAAAQLCQKPNLDTPELVPPTPVNTDLPYGPSLPPDFNSESTGLLGSSFTTKFKETHEFIEAPLDRDNHRSHRHKHKSKKHRKHKKH